MDNENKLQKVKSVFGSIIKPFADILSNIKNVLVLLFLTRIPTIITIVLFIAGLGFGARVHETGYLAGFFGKTLKGATVTLSGPCKVNGISRIPALAEDEVKITGEEGGIITGVVRKTREIVICEQKSVSIDKLPLLSNLKKSPTEIPELTAMKVEVKDPEWKKLVQKTLVMSGQCLSVTGKELPAFTDEKVDVTNVEAAKDQKEGSSEDAFIITGIKKSDKIAITCSSTSVKYALFFEKQESVAAQPEVQVIEKPHSFIGETILVTSTCFPDPRLPKHKVDKKVAFYPLVNSPVQITEENIDANGKLKKIAGAALQFGQMIVCDGNKFPLTYKPYDADTMKLQQMHPTDKGMESDEAPAVPAAAGSALPAGGSEKVKDAVSEVNKKNLLIGQ